MKSKTKYIYIDLTGKRKKTAKDMEDEFSWGEKFTKKILSLHRFYVHGIKHFNWPTKAVIEINFNGAYIKMQSSSRYGKKEGWKKVEQEGQDNTPIPWID